MMIEAITMAIIIIVKWKKKVMKIKKVIYIQIKINKILQKFKIHFLLMNIKEKLKIIKIKFKHLM